MKERTLSWRRVKDEMKREVGEGEKETKEQI